eukprot:Skav204018  [mRNA]  locus=scaffold229:27438:28982:+ [translate_table: standard]
MPQLETADDNDPLVQGTWEKTLEELGKGYIWRDDSQGAGTDIVLAKRFGLIQRGGKLRVIDDCAHGDLNSTLGIVEKYRVHAIDECAAFLAWCLDYNRKHGLHVVLLDLKTAYKQYDVSSSDRSFLRLAVRNPVNHCVSLFGVNSLPFGATGSVGGFLRVSFGLWAIGLSIFRPAWTAYFDDFTMFCRDVLEGNTTKTVETLFDLLGVSFAREGEKTQKFCSKFKSLGVELDLQDFSKGKVSIGHTQERREELHAVLDDIIKQGSVSSKQSESLRGRMRWFESFAFGRVASGAVKILGDIAAKNRKCVQLDRREFKAVSFLRDRVCNAPPLVITPSCLKSWVVFTDGALEGPEGEKTGGVGGVIFPPDGACVQYFREAVPDSLLALLLQRSKDPIYELEVAPVLIAVMLWGKMMATSQVCWYVDNGAARSAYLKACGATEIADALVDHFAALEMLHQLKSWIARVPSYSNPADAPSRFEDSELRDRKALKVPVDWPAVAEIVQAVFSKGKNTAA